MKSLFIFIILSLGVAIANAGCIPSDKALEEVKKIKEIRAKNNLETKPFKMMSYPSVQFQDADLPRFWMGPQFIEMTGEPKPDGRMYYQAICYKDKAGICTQWCVIRKDSPQFYTEASKDEALKQCEKCEDDESKCDGGKILKDIEQELVINTATQKPSVVKKSKDGRLLVFQTNTEGKIDAKKPYVELIQVNSGDKTYQRMTSVGGALAATSAESNFTVAEYFGYYGFRVCEVTTLSLNNCSTNIPSIKYPGISHNCQPYDDAKGKPTTSPSSSDVESAN